MVRLRATLKPYIQELDKNVTANGTVLHVLTHTVTWHNVLHSVLCCAHTAAHDCPALLCSALLCIAPVRLSAMPDRGTAVRTKLRHISGLRPLILVGPPDLRRGSDDASARLRVPRRRWLPRHQRPGTFVLLKPNHQSIIMWLIDWLCQDWLRKHIRKCYVFFILIRWLYVPLSIVRVRGGIIMNDNDDNVMMM